MFGWREFHSVLQTCSNKLEKRNRRVEGTALGSRYLMLNSVGRSSFSGRDGLPAE